MCKIYDNFFGKTVLLNNKELKDQSTVFVSQESKSVIDDMLDFAFDGVALILNLLINILVLGFFLIMIYWWRMLLDFYWWNFYFYHKNQISKMSKISQKSRIYFIAILNKIWDNVIIFNQYNVGIFNRIYKRILTAQKISYSQPIIQSINF